MKQKPSPIPLQPIKGNKGGKKNGTGDIRLQFYSRAFESTIMAILELLHTLMYYNMVINYSN